MSTKFLHPLLAMIASATDRELAKQVQYLKEENKILRARIPGQIHTKPAERERLIKFGKLNLFTKGVDGISTNLPFDYNNALEFIDLKLEGCTLAPDNHGKGVFSRNKSCSK